MKIKRHFVVYIIPILGKVDSGPRKAEVWLKYSQPKGNFVFRSGLIAGFKRYH